MTPEQRQLVEKIYPEVMALPESEQVAFLSERCGDQRVRRRVPLRPSGRDRRGRVARGCGRRRFAFRQAGHPSQ